MSTVLYPSPVFGPIHSRRLGVSLGINLMPEDGKVCTTVFIANAASIPTIVPTAAAPQGRRWHRHWKRNSRT